MKTTALAIFALAILGGAAHSQVPVGPASIKVGKIEISAPSTPEYQVTGGQNKRYKLGKWLEFEVSYDTVPDEIDELTFRYTVQIENKLLDGEVTYVNIAKGRDHYAVMYLSPKSIDKLTGGKPLTPASIQNAWVEVTRQGQILGRTAFRQQNIPNVPHIAGMLLIKSATPFAPLYYDRYEEIKAVR